MTRGVLGYFISASMSSIETIKSMSNMYNLPFLTWSNYPKAYYNDNKVVNQTSKIFRSKRDLNTLNDFDRFKRQSNDVIFDQKNLKY